MKVLLVVPRLNIGGAESYVFTLAVGLRNRGIDVVIVSGGGHLANELKVAGVKHYYCPIRLNRYLAAMRSPILSGGKKLNLFTPIRPQLLMQPLLPEKQ